MLPNNTPQQSAQNQPASDTPVGKSLHVTDILLIIVSHWPWILICVLLSWLVAETYLRFTKPLYTREASMLIKESSNNPSMGAVVGYGDAKVFAQTPDVTNEIFMLKSPVILTEVINRLDLCMEYSCEGRVNRATLYGSNLPVTVDFLDVDDRNTAGLTLELGTDSTVVLSKFFLNQSDLSGTDIKGRLNQVVTTPVGKVVVKPTSFYYRCERPIQVEQHTMQATMAFYTSEFEVSSTDNSSIINMKVEDCDAQKAEDILYSVISIYNELWMKDRNQISVSTNQFINERLEVIENELGNVEGDISHYKSTNLIVGDAESMAGMYMGQAQNASTQLIELNNQLYMARSVRGYLTNEQNFTQLLPASQGFSNASITGQIEKYNQMLLRRNNLVSVSSLQNPIVQDLDVQLAELRRTLIGSIDTHISEINLLIRSAEGVQSSNQSRVAATPGQSRYLLSVERQQKVKESLYLFLLQKREENELSQAFTAYNNRVITPPSGNLNPTFPIPFKVYTTCLLIGFALPIAILILLELTNTSVRGRKDLDNLNIPFIGEVPLDHPGSKLSRAFKRLTRRFARRNKHHKEDKTLHILVKDDKTDVMNEAFRVVRANMEFVAGRSEEARVIMLTSFNPNSGKTFVVSNLAITLTFKKKRILVIDLDMRKRSLSALNDKHAKGLSNYLGGYIDDYHDIIQHVKDFPNMDILPAGKIPPNPTELLYEQSLDTLLKQVRKEYDYIFLDCPPLEIVADASIISRLADMTIFVIRAEALELTALPDVQKYYDENRLPKMTILLNGTTDAFSRYGYHRYGSRYGYTYGHGRSYSYGYGYAAGEKEE